MIRLRRQITALFVALAVFIGGAPAVFAVPSASHSAMAGMAMKAGSMDCTGMMQQSKQQMPCNEKNSRKCPSMLGCYTFSVALPQTESVLLLAYKPVGRVATLRNEPDGISLQPDHPPPIV
jgi:hypothetical protein